MDTAGTRARSFAVAVGIVVLALAVLAAILGTWWDEEYTMASTAHGVAYAVDRALHFELQAPLYFILLALWRGLDASLLFARLFSVLCVGGLCYAFRAIALRIRPDADPLPFVLLTVANPFVVYAALEVRLYALALLLSALLWIAFYDGFLAGDDRRARIAFALLAIAAIYTQYYLGFTLAAAFIALLITRRWTALGAFVAISFGIALAIAPVALWVPAQAASGYTAVQGAAHSGVLTTVRTLAGPLMLFALPFSDDWSGPWRWLRFAHHLAFVAGLAALLAWSFRRTSHRDLAFLAIPLVIWGLYLGAAIFAHVQYSIPRHFVALFVPLIAAEYAVFAIVRARGGVTWGRALAILYAAFTLATLLTTYRALAKAGDWPRVAAFLNARTRAGDVVAVFPSRGYAEVMRSYRGPANVVGFPRAEPAGRFDELYPAVHSEADASNTLHRLRDGHRVWLIVEGTCSPIAGIQDGCYPLNAVLARDYANAKVTGFFLNRVLEIPSLPRPAAGTRTPPRS
jgi:hypothetical protein